MPKQSFFETEHCQSRTHCYACRKDPAFRRSIAASFAVPGEDFACPYGIGNNVGLPPPTATKAPHKVLVNPRDPKTIISPVWLLRTILPKIRQDAILAAALPQTLLAGERAEADAEAETCSDCALNRLGLPLLRQFARELKGLPLAKQHAVLALFGKRVWVVHEGKRVNLLTNEVEEIKYETKAVTPEQPKKAEAAVVPEQPQPNLSPEPILDDRPVAPGKTGEIPVGKLAGLVHATAENPIAAQHPQETHPVRGVNAPVPVLQSVREETKVRKIILQSFLSPGDIVMMTAAVRDISLAFPKKFQIDVRTNAMLIWESNPYITPLDEKDPDVEVIRCEYPLINQSNQGPNHFSEGYTQFLETKLGIRVPRRLCRGDIHMRGQEERGWFMTEMGTWLGEYGLSADTDYWVIDAGHKRDFTCKRWPGRRYQEVVDYFSGRILFVQIGHESHIHPPLKRVVNLIGKTDDRQLIRVVWGSSGVLTPVSLPMTLAAAIPVMEGRCYGLKDRPCVVLSGGREPSRWQAYNNHQFIHCCGALPCCADGACWASRYAPIGDGDTKDASHMCKSVVSHPEDGEIPFCMDLITPDEVIRRIELYLAWQSPARPPIHCHEKR